MKIKKLLKPQNNLKLLNSKGIAHIGVAVLAAGLVVGAAVMIYIRKTTGPSGETVITEERERLTGNNLEDSQDIEIDSSEDSNTNDNKGGNYYVVFNDESVTFEQDPLTVTFNFTDTWAQTCDGLYSRWEGTSHQESIFATSAGEDRREGTGEFSFVVNKGDGKLSADKSTITMKHRYNCINCSDPYIELTGKVVPGTKVACD